MAITQPVFLDVTAQSILATLQASQQANEQMSKDISIIAAANAPSIVGNWLAYRALVSSGQGARLFPVGTKITDSWVDTAATQTYSAYEWHVADYVTKTLRDESTLTCAVLQAHWAHPFGVQFSRSRAFLRCPSGLAAGTYFFSFGTYSSGSISGQTVQFTLASAVPAGGRLCMNSGLGDVAASGWRVYSYGADGITLIETVTPTLNPETPSGTDLGTLNTNSRNGDLNSAQETAWGCNRWKTSAIRQYLNSAAAAGAWWTAQDEWDIAPNELATKAGYLSGFDEDFLSVLREVRVVTYGNTVTEGGVEDVTYDRIWLPSLGEMYINPQVNGEGDPLEYWKLVNGTDTKWQQGQTYPILRHYALENHASAQHVRLRSAHRGIANVTWHVYSSGYVNGYYGASYSYRFAPLAAIG